MTFCFVSDVRPSSRWCLTPYIDTDPSLYDQVLHTVLWDLVYLANCKYKIQV